MTTATGAASGRGPEMGSATNLSAENRIPGRLTVTATEFDVVWEWLGLGATPVVLQLTSPGRTDVERRRIVDTAWQGLRQRQLADVTGPDPEIIRLMHLFAAPSEQVELRIWAERETRALATRRNGATALTLRRGEEITLSSAVTPNRALLGVLPAAVVGPGHSVTLPEADLTAAYDDLAAGCPVREGLISRGVDTGDAELIEAIFTAVIGRAQVSALAADSWGVLHRLRQFITALDTRHGRYLLRRDPAGDGSNWITISPTDPRRTLHRMDELLTQATMNANRT